MSENLEKNVKMPQKMSIIFPDTRERTNVSSSYKLLGGSPIPHY